VVCAKWFAKILQDIYLNVKYFNGHDVDPTWQVNLISGALFTFDLNDGSSYMNDTYWYGKNEWAWDWTHQQTGSYPLDGIGQHLYVEQGSSNAATITNALNTNISGMWNIIASYEGANTSKQIWISEFGWESSNITEQGQADNLQNAYSFLLNDNRIALATWFTLSDWPGAYWGLYYFGNFSPADRKLAYYEFLNVTNCTATAVSEIKNTTPTLSFDQLSGNYILNLPENPMAHGRKIELWNAWGEKIAENVTSAETGNRIIKKGNYSGGVYFLRVDSENGSSVFKLIF
jgi:hypothetical protein